MLNKAGGSANRGTRVTETILIALVALALVVPAFRLHANGLWADEFFTVYFSDPALLFGAALRRAAEDIHPPAYAMIVRLLRETTNGDGATVARGFALACSFATLLVLAAALRPRMGRLALLFSLAAAAQSAPFLSTVTEARSYALAELLVTIDIALLLPLLAAVHGRRTGLPLAILLILGGLVHSYLVLTGIAIALYLAAVAPNWRWGIGWMLVALLVASAAEAVAHWQAPYIVADVTHVWFSAAPRAQAGYVVRGAMLAIVSPLGIAALGLALRLAPWRQRVSGGSDLRSLLATPVGLAIFVIAVTTTAAIGYSILVMPVLSRRLFLVLAPFFWLLAAEVFRATLDQSSRWTGVLLAVALVGGLRVFDAGQQAIEPWRETAQALRAIPGCAHASLAVSGLERASVRGSEAAIFYGYYDPGASGLELISRKAPPAVIADRALTIHGASACPVLFWSVHHVRRNELLAIAELLRQDPRLPAGVGVEVVEFATPRPVALLPHFARRDIKGSGFLVRLVPRPH